MDFDLSTIIYIIIAILFSLFSGKKKANKNKREREFEEESDAPETSLEEEIRKMAERMTGKKTEEEKPETVTASEPEHKRPEYATPYERYDGKTNYDRDTKPLEQIPTEPVTDYSANDIESLREYNERLKRMRYEEKVENYEAKSVDSLLKGKELHTIMEEKDTNNTVEEIIDNRFDMSDFDARKAIIYAEILKRPQY